MLEIPSGIRSSRVLLTGLALFYLLSLWLIAQQYRIPFLADKIDHVTGAKTLSVSGSTADITSAARNATLGFGKVFVINLKDRTDKLDAFTLAASLTGFDVDVIEGVRGVDIALKAMPPNKVPENKSDWDQNGFNNIAGCWRSHINFANRIVTGNLLSGLVIEDDADWDVHLKDQLEQLAVGSQYVRPGANNTVPESPYGDDWDLLWLGHCGSSFSTSETRRYVIENDPTVPPPNHRSNNKVPDFAAAGYDNSSRVVYTASGGLCTQAYALSLRGARKIIQHYTNVLDFAPIDIGLHSLCNSQPVGFKCIGIFPQIWGSHRSAGAINRDSDINTSGKKKGPVQIRKKPMTFNIVYSMRMNAANILEHGIDAITPQWDDMPTLNDSLKARFD